MLRVLVALALAGSAALAMPVVAAAQTASGGSGWSQLQGGPGHTGSRAEAPPPPYRATWTSRPHAAGQQLSAPVFSANTIVVTSPSAVYAVSATDGSVVWSAQRNAVAVPPAIASVDGHDAVISTDGRGPDTATIDALDLSNGRSLWDSPASLKDQSKSGVTVDGTRAFVGDESGNLYAVDVADGTLAWTATTGGTLAGPVAAGGGLVVGVVGASDTDRLARVVAFDEATGRVRWNVSPDVGATIGSVPVVAGGVVAVAFSDGEVVGLSADDGSQTWAEGIQTAVVSPLVAGATAGDGFIFADSSGGVHLVTPGAGGGWLYEFNEPILRASPVVAGGAVLVGLEDGSVGAVSLRTGHLVYRSAANAAPVSGIAVTPDAVVVSRGGSPAPPAVSSYATDPNGASLDEPSPTVPAAGTLALGLAVGLAVAAAIFVAGRSMARRTAIRDPSLAGADDPESSPDDQGAVP